MELLVRLPDLQTLDVRVECRVATVTIDNGPINLMDEGLLRELDQLVRWLSKQGDSVQSKRQQTLSAIKRKKVR